MTDEQRERGPIEIDLHDLITFGLYTNWSQQGCGFGQLSVSVNLLKEEGRVCMRITGDTETMGREWMRKALHALADTLANAIPEEGLSGDVDVPIPPEVLAHWDELQRFMDGNDESQS